MSNGDQENGGIRSPQAPEFVRQAADAVDLVEQTFTQIARTTAVRGVQVAIPTALLGSESGRQVTAEAAGVGARWARNAVQFVRMEFDDAIQEGIRFAFVLFFPAILIPGIVAAWIKSWQFDALFVTGVGLLMTLWAMYFSLRRTRLLFTIGLAKGLATGDDEPAFSFAFIRKLFSSGGSEAIRAMQHFHVRFWLIYFWVIFTWFYECMPWCYFGYPKPLPFVWPLFPFGLAAAGFLIIGNNAASHGNRRDSEHTDRPGQKQYNDDGTARKPTVYAIFEFASICWLAFMALYAWYGFAQKSGLIIIHTRPAVVVTTAGPSDTTVTSMGRTTIVPKAALSMPSAAALDSSATAVTARSDSTAIAVVPSPLDSTVERSLTVPGISFTSVSLTAPMATITPASAKERRKLESWSVVLHNWWLHWKDFVNGTVDITLPWWARMLLVPLTIITGFMFIRARLRLRLTVFIGVLLVFASAATFSGPLWFWGVLLLSLTVLVRAARNRPAPAVARV